jgi:predicted transcriptional regulator
MEAAIAIALKRLKRNRPLPEIIEDTGLDEKAIRELAAENSIQIKMMRLIYLS